MRTINTESTTEQTSAEETLAGQIKSINSGRRGSFSSSELKNTQSSNLASGCRISGDLELSGTVQLNCVIEGEIESTGELTLGPDAVVEGNIFADTLVLYGQLRGDVKCETRLELKSGARLVGNVLSPRMSVQDGAIFEGRCWMGEEQLHKEFAHRIGELKKPEVKTAEPQKEAE